MTIRSFLVNCYCIAESMPKEKTYRIKEKNGYCDFTMTGRKDEIYIDRITASVTGKGVGQKAFSKITELADVHNVVLILICTPTDLSYSERLTNFYIRNNFSKVSYDLMVRLPTKDRGKKRMKDLTASVVLSFQLPDWFKEKTEKQQKDYLERHPNSRLARHFKAKTDKPEEPLPKSEDKPKVKQKKPEKKEQPKEAPKKPEVVQPKFSGPTDSKGSAFNKPKAERKVVSILNTLAKVVQKAKQDGTEPPDFDLCRISIPGSNLFCDLNKGIPRKKMPQLKGKPSEGSWADKNLPKDDKGEVDGEQAFRNHLTDIGVRIEKSEVPATSLKSTQSQLVGAKVAGMYDALKENPDNPGIRAPIFVSRDGYILDGHHRWASVVAYDLADGVKESIPMNVQVVDMDIEDLVKETNNFAEQIGIAAKAGAVIEHAHIEKFLVFSRCI